MSVHHSNANPEQDTQPAPAAELRQPRTRRALLAGLLGGAGALVAGAVGRVNPIRAVVANPVLMGVNNDAGTGNTSLTTQSTGTALLVTQNGSGTALRGSAVGAGSIAGFFTAQNGTGISGVTGNPGSYGVFGQNNGAAGSAGAMRADGKNNHGLVATTANADANAVRAVQQGSTTGSGAAIVAEGVRNNAIVASTTGLISYAIHAVNTGSYNPGIPNSTAGAGIYGEMDSGTGVVGFTVGGTGVAGVAQSGFGVSGNSDSASGVSGFSNSADGVQGGSSTGTAISGTSESSIGIYANSLSNIGLYATTQVPLFYPAAHIEGDLEVNGAVSATSANASIKAFRIDHPLDPANKVLMHSCVESNERKLVYDGVVTADASGQAAIELPNYFHALNTDLRYQLTAIGAPMRDLHVSSGVKGNRFSIAGAAPGQEVSWQVTGIRRDAYAAAHPLVVESRKTGRERGKYLNPVEHGQPASAGVMYEVQLEAEAVAARGGRR
jgi:hypothetical protein